MRKKLPLIHSLLWILTATLLISGSAVVASLYLKHLHNVHLKDDTYLIRHIMQTGPQKEQLKTAYLAELLDLSDDQPTNLYELDLHEAARRLLKSPVIERVRLKRVRPSTLYIDYTVREPIARFTESANTALDAQSCAFPLHPFYTPKKLPEVVLGHSKCRDLAIELIQTLHEPDFHLLRVDVSQADHPCYGRRQILCVFQEGEVSCVVRLSPHNYRTALNNYLRLRDNLAIMPKLIDLRISNLAYLK